MSEKIDPLSRNKFGSRDDTLFITMEFVSSVVRIFFSRVYEGTWGCRFEISSGTESPWETGFSFSSPHRVHLFFFLFDIVSTINVDLREARPGGRAKEKGTSAERRFSTEDALPRATGTEKIPKVRPARSPHRRSPEEQNFPPRRRDFGRAARRARFTLFQGGSHDFSLWEVLTYDIERCREKKSCGALLAARRRRKGSRNNGLCPQWRRTSTFFNASRRPYTSQLSSPKSHRSLSHEFSGSHETNR